MDTNKKIREHISALTDGELAASDLELAFAALRARDGEQAWDAYHRIGDELRAQATPELSDDFGERLAARLAAEPAPARRGLVHPPAAEAPVAEAAPDLKKVAATS
ncbi:sigma-E factor negative regulatory protein [Massilia sp. R2A-15]|uniref:sigma-E factor negative regulatory protein n=1 Tax=Massilia sp. R2A-15 TaxID=3064278 RepID=UPI002734D5DB|nr:sigma-E factor negative regulatory protein [Massilia sp. R2A-15]WLI91663.1 sigma-E factor negative regulatory protein [Massilia sp. R2A-15]